MRKADGGKLAASDDAFYFAAEKKRQAADYGKRHVTLAAFFVFVSWFGRLVVPARPCWKTRPRRDGSVQGRTSRPSWRWRIDQLGCAGNALPRPPRFCAMVLLLFCYCSCSYLLFWQRAPLIGDVSVWLQGRPRSNSQMQLRLQSGKSKYCRVLLTRTKKLYILIYIFMRLVCFIYYPG